MLFRAGCKPASLVETFCLPGRWAGAAPSPSLGPQPGPAGVPGRPRPRCLTPASCSLPAGHQEALQPHPGGDFPLLLVPPPDQQPHLLHRRAGKGHPRLGAGLCGGRCLSLGLFLGGPAWDRRKSPGVAAAGEILLGCRAHRGCDSRVSLGRAQRVPSSWGPLGGTRGWQAVPGPGPEMRLPSRPLLGPRGNGGGRGCPLLGPSLELPPRPQVSHHPPVSAFHVSNRKDGFCISGSITAKSRFYGERGAAPWGLPGGLGETGWGED